MGLGLLARWVGALHVLSYLLPGTYASGLISPDVLVALGSVGALCAFAALFLGSSVGVLRARDL